MKTFRLAIIAAALAACSLLATSARAAEVSLESRNFNEFALAVNKIPPDCVRAVNRDATLEHLRYFLMDKLSPFAAIDYSDVTPHLSVKIDCMKLEDARGEGRDIGYAVNITAQFYRPFYEDITYVHAATWTNSSLTYWPYAQLNQEVFNAEIDLVLEQFVQLWLDEHKALSDTDDKRMR